jgi:hypothetical protein
MMTLEPIAQVWALLQTVRTFREDAYIENMPVYSGMFLGKVTINCEQPNVQVFNITGTWQSLDHTEVAHSTVLQWTNVGESLHLSVLRDGWERPVLLFDLRPDENGNWSDTRPHMCRNGRKPTLIVQGQQVLVECSMEVPKMSTTFKYLFW